MRYRSSVNTNGYMQYQIKNDNFLLDLQVIAGHRTTSNGTIGFPDPTFLFVCNTCESSSCDI